MAQLPRHLTQLARAAPRVDCHSAPHSASHQQGVYTFYLPQFFCPKILAQNLESYNGKQYFKIGGIERKFKERSVVWSVEKLLFDIERVVTTEVTLD